MKPVTKEEKNKQIKKEAFATVILFIICFIWHVGFGYGLSGVPIYIFNLPLWWIISTPGVFVVGVVGVIILLKKDFVNFDLNSEEDSNDDK